METWFEVDRYTAKIKVIDVVKFTAKTVVELRPADWKGVRRERKRLIGDDLFRSWKDAHAALCARAAASLEQARLNLQRAQGFHGNVVGMKEPTP